ncbi:antibiotic biosynthesis monooxygenase family protein [Clostridioides difficile CD160]|nr:antibiotic biosynthesis monooxygenase family protein [Clostridioides difficile CD160]
MKIITEIVEFSVEENLSKDEFIEIVNDLEMKFHSIQPGFIDTELLYDEKSQKWIMIQHWDSMEDLKNSSSKMFKDSSTEKFRKALKSQTVKMNIMPQLKSWKL